MKVITAFNKFLKTEKVLFLEEPSENIRVIVHKENDFIEEFGQEIANRKVKRINELESPGAVTIYI